MPFDQKKILIEKRDWIAVHKSPGQLVVVDRWGKEPKENILLYQVAAYLRDQGHKADESGRDLYPVHRLDRDTSGVVLFAKNADAHRALSQLFEGRQMQKIYWAFCQGSPAWDIATSRIPLSRAEGKSGRGRALVDLSHGKPSETLFRVLGREEGMTWIEATPKTGRLHQIRLHLKMLGLPILADPLYGISAEKKIRMPLHARKLSFEDPCGGGLIEIECPLDEELRTLVTKFEQRRSTRV